MSRTPKRISEPPLQPLRIPDGWTVAFNTLFELDPGFRSYDDGISEYFREDMLQIESKRLGVIVDLGWYPSCRPAGAFRVVAVRYYEDKEGGWTGDWDRPLRSIRTRSRRKVVEAIEGWLRWYSDRPPRARRVRL